jgi:RHS repeat-associated protein
VFYVFYDIWGNIEAKTLDWLPFAYTGKELDKESGLYYFGARYYSPDIGRFITEDPVKGGDKASADPEPVSVVC